MTPLATPSWGGGGVQESTTGGDPQALLAGHNSCQKAVHPGLDGQLPLPVDLLQLPLQGRPQGNPVRGARLSSLWSLTVGNHWGLNCHADQRPAREEPGVCQK